MSTQDKLPPLPMQDVSRDNLYGYTADQMRAYARAALAAQADSWNRAGREPVPFHPDASHVSPDYRDGWNAALAALAAQEAEPVPNPASDSPFDQALGAYASAVWHHDMAGMRKGYVALRDLFASQYAAPPAREAVALTEDEIAHLTGHCGVSKWTAINVARAVIAAFCKANNLREPT